MLNKILSKKIKFPLSLRGAKQRSNLSGFSLIELMVAITILAMAIFGIFQAYSTGFMGMADARDRTVATNYAREAMEDIKNKDFDQIVTQSRYSINETKYEREVIVQEISNLKKVTTKVYWKDRNETWKTVEADIVVHFIETTADVATRIILYADPYNVLTGGNSSKLTAVIKDAKGNTILNWDKDINFLLTASDDPSSAVSGTLSSDAISPDDFVDGRAIITFTSGVAAEEVTITASSGSLTPDSVTIKVTDINEPVKINFTEDEISINTISMLPGNSTLLTATIIDAAGDTVTEATNDITFSVSDLGTLSNQSALEHGVVTIDLISTTTPGTITVTASASGLEPGVINIYTGGWISLSASIINVPVNEQSVITITTKDVSGVPINYIGDIKLSLESLDGGSGFFTPSELSTIEINFNGNSSSKTTTFYAASEGTVNVNAQDIALILEEGEFVTLSLTIKPALVPDHIQVYAIPSSISVGGTEISLIAAKVMTEGNIAITSYNKSITFITTAGHFSNESQTITIEDPDVNYVDGVATVELYSALETGTATITVSSTVSEGPPIQKITGDTEVGFYIGPDHIKLRANPQNILAGGKSCILTAEIVDYNGTLISDYNEDIAFSISPCPATIKFLKADTSFLTLRVKKGIAKVTLISGIDAGTAVIEAYSGDVSGSLNIPVGINLDLVNDSPFYNSTDNSVSFEIEIVGADFTLEEIKISWDLPDNETLNKIEIKSPSDDLGFYTAYASNYHDINIPGYPASSGDLINIQDDINLLENKSKIILYFNDSSIVPAGGRTFDVIFNPNSGNYLVEFTVPSSS